MLCTLMIRNTGDTSALPTTDDSEKTLRQTPRIKKTEKQQRPFRCTNIQRKTRLQVGPTVLHEMRKVGKHPRRDVSPEHSYQSLCSEDLTSNHCDIETPISRIQNRNWRKKNEYHAFHLENGRARIAGC